MAREARHDGSEWIVWIDPETGQERRVSPSSNLTVAAVAAKNVPAGVPWGLMRPQPHGRSPAVYEPRIELPPQAQPVPVPIQVPADDSLARMVGWQGQAIYRLTLGAQAGDLRWHGGASDFTWQGKAYDAPGFIEHVRTKLLEGQE